MSRSETRGLQGSGENRATSADSHDLIRVRGAHRALRTGDLAVLTSDDRPTPVLAFTRGDAGDRLLVLHNLGDRAATAGPYVGEGAIPSADRMEPVLLDPGVGAPKVGTGGVTVELPPHATGIWRLAPPGR